ncbi:glutamate ABC transporter substrate-binding protein [Streptomyces phaeoluteigriseus]|uniref:Glutamate ABC transporter substrate-binding protein n=1 Tax=Streptomyces phaeoluteigriseus TaxID=114686 RepID=A0A1V6MVT3_9ACTN|nr:glutamate ABC transporter substrate-binding protein [Streptomyces phaeoluteigriseus]OQD56406.1 glutamate-binding protein [Streptomyces phaeoluteigriseus]USQ83867.1 glutamate ABC transporter substrate-binding protein [Streptomyces phaeoluteigriseus]
MKLRKVSAASAAVLALALAATACGSDDKDDTSSGSSGGGDKIKIGIKYDQPGLGLKEPDGSFSGFDVDVATYVAKELGYEPNQITFVETKSADRENALARGDVKFIAATYSINDERAKKVDFAGPYLLAHQDLLVKKDSDIAKGADLNGKNLCSVTGSTSAQNVRDKIAPKANLKQLGGYSECISALQSGAVDAVTTDDSILAGFAAQDKYKGQFKLVGEKLSNENYGVGVKKGDKATVDKINAALEKMVSDGAWDKAVTENFGPAEYKNEKAPKIGVIVK